MCLNIEALQCKGGENYTLRKMGKIYIIKEVGTQKVDVKK
jgi:hypothetical protein